MITLERALQIHDLLISKFGGSSGVREQGGLLSAIERPFQSFSGQELYPTPSQKAAALLQSILTNHPFVDGNKRTGYVLMHLALIEAGQDISASEDEKYAFVLLVAKGELTFEQIVLWIEQHLYKQNGG